MLLVGTSGFKYKDWKGVFYPAGTPDGDLLPFYSTVFSAVELDFSYYRMPSARTMQALERKTPEGFLFAVKAHKSMTHEPMLPEELDKAFGEFRASLEPLDNSGKLGCVLLQFPWGFRPGLKEKEYIRYSRRKMGDVPLVVEFRNAEWLTESTFRLLRDLGVAFCAVDEPRLKGLVPPVITATSNLGYVRFHGRNAAKWWRHKTPSERYDYLYSEEELQEWVPRILSLSEKTGRTLVFFNNCHEGKAGINARRMKDMLSPWEGRD